jgi:hypothetical protein
VIGITTGSWFWCGWCSLFVAGGCGGLEARFRFARLCSVLQAAGRIVGVALMALLPFAVRCCAGPQSQPVVGLRIGAICAVNPKRNRLPSPTCAQPSASTRKERGGRGGRGEAENLEGAATRLWKVRADEIQGKKGFESSTSTLANQIKGVSRRY